MAFDWADAHCHLADPKFASNLSDVLERSRKAGVSYWLQGGVDRDDWDRQIELSARVGPSFGVVLGVHPWRAAQLGIKEIDSQLAYLTQLKDSLVAVGEAGLDAMPRFSSPEALRAQSHAFRAQLKLARDWNKPVVLHIVRAHEEAIRVLEESGPYPKGGLVHAFSGSVAVARQYENLNFVVSIGPQLLRPGYKDLKAAIVALPKESFVLETDSPDQTSEPIGVIEVAEAIAKLRNVTTEEVLTQSRENLRRVIGF